MAILKILECLYKWNYLTVDQLALLLKQKPNVIASEIYNRILPKDVLKINQLTRKNIYQLNKKGHDMMSPTKFKATAPKYYELKHQQMQVEYLSQFSKIEHYETEYELKKNDPEAEIFPDLIIWTTDNRKFIIEIERTKKADKLYEKKLMNFKNYFQEGFQLIYVTDSEGIKKYLEKIIINFNSELVSKNTKIELFKT